MALSSSWVKKNCLRCTYSCSPSSFCF